MDQPIIRVALVEDHPEYRETIKMALLRETDLELTESFGTAERAIKSLKAASQKPDILLIDLSLPGTDGLTALAEFRAILPDAKMLILTQSESEQDVIRAIALGASGYLLKSSTVRQITEGIRSALKGGVPLDPTVAQYVVDTLRNKLPKSERNILSPREMQVMELLAEGQVQKEIADKLGISTTTVITHIGHIYDKLDANNAPAAVAKAFGLGILPTSGEKT